MEAVRTNIIGTDNLLHVTVEAGVKQFILLSTMSVYGLTVGSISKEPKVNPEIIYSHSMLYQPIPATPEKDTTDFVFAGNIGKVQNLDEVFRAVKIIQDEKHS